MSIKTYVVKVTGEALFLQSPRLLVTIKQLKKKGKGFKRCKNAPGRDCHSPAMRSIPTLVPECPTAGRFTVSTKL